MIDTDPHYLTPVQPDPRILTSNEVRQGRRGSHTLAILLVSLFLAAIAVTGLVMWSMAVTHQIADGKIQQESTMPTD